MNHGDLRLQHIMTSDDDEKYTNTQMMNEDETAKDERERVNVKEEMSNTANQRRTYRIQTSGK